MSDKKVRGLKRKTKSMVNRLEQETMKFPSDFYNGYWHLHLPIAQDFIASIKTPKATKRLCIQTLLDRAEHLKRIKPPSSDDALILENASLLDAADFLIEKDVYVVDKEFNWTYVRTHETGWCGPYYCRKKSYID